MINIYEVLQDQKQHFVSTHGLTRLPHQTFLLLLVPGEDALARNLLRQNESKPSLPHKINYFSLHKECKTFILGTKLATDFHIPETE